MNREASANRAACSCVFVGLLLIAAWSFALALLGAMVQGCGNADPRKDKGIEHPQSWERTREPPYDLYVHKLWTPHQRHCIRQSARAVLLTWMQANPLSVQVGGAPWTTTRASYNDGSIWLYPPGTFATGAVGEGSHATGMLDADSVPYGPKMSQIHLLVDGTDLGTPASGYTLPGLTRLVDLHQALHAPYSPFPDWDPQRSNLARWAYVDGVEAQARLNAYSAVSILGGWKP